MRISRKAVAVFLVTSASILTLLVFSLNTFIEKNRDRIREEVQMALGRSLTFDQLHLTFWGGLGLSAKHLRIAEDPRFAATPFVQTKELKMQVRWLPLFLGDIEIKKFILAEPEIQIIKNEAGNLNISALASPERAARETREVKERKRRTSTSLLVPAIHVTNGKIDYIDRSFKEPVEIRIRNVEMDLKGLALTERAKVKLAANLFEGQGQKMSVEGRVGPFQGGRDWTQDPLDLQFQFDSLLVPQLTRAIPFLREKIPPDLGITGPLMLKARLLGTFERPRISNLTLTGALFGATENNATVKGELDFSRGGPWAQGEIKGKIVVDPLSLDHFKRIPFLNQALPTSLNAKGPLSVASELQGSLEDLKVYALIKAGESEIRYGDWLKKAKGIPAEMEVKVGRQKDRLLFGESTLTIHNLKLRFSGSLEESPERRLMLRLRTDGVDLSGWDRLLLPLSSYSTGGNLRWDLSIKKDLGVRERDFDIQGALNLENTQAKDRKSGRGIEKMRLRVSFLGQEARIESGEGTWEGIPFGSLKGELRWLHGGFGFKDLSLQALGGTFRGSGTWELRAENSQRLALNSNIEAMDLKTLLSQKFPKFKDHIEGRLNFKAMMRGESKNGSTLQESLHGEGETQVRGGSLKDFNLVERVLSKVTGLPGISNLISARMPSRYRTLFERRDTPFDTLAATFTVEQERIHTQDLLMATPDYIIRAEGWIGFDKKMKWNATLVMSPQFTQELMQEHKNVRYLMDQQGRLAVPFRLEGTLPHVQPKPDLKGLAELIQRGLLRRGMERALGGEKERKKKDRREWIQKGLEELFGK